MAEAKDPIRLLMTTDTVGGVWTYALELVKALQPHGVEFHLASMGRLPSEEQAQEAAQLTNLQLYTSSYALEWMENPWEEVDAAGEWLLALERELKPDIIHLNNYCHGHLSWSAPVLMVGHSCVLSWWKAVKGEEAPERYAAYASRVKQGLQAADLVVAPTQAYLDQLKQYYGPFAQETVIANGRDAALFAPAKKEALVLSAGRLWDEAKNIAACEPAAAKLPWPIAVAGESQHPGSGQERVYTHLRALGRLSPDAMAAAMAKAAIYTMPARYEPFGLSILEAALSGCALVLGDIPSLKENWEGAALFADPTNPDALREQLLFLIYNPRKREELAALAQKRAEAFSLEAQGKAYMQQYRRLLGSDKAASSNLLTTELFFFL